MKKCAILIIFLTVVVTGYTQERILQYNSTITIEEPGSILVREDITVVAEGNNIRRGIYRSFPTHYKDRMGTRFDVGFDVVSITRDGDPEPWFTEKKGNGVYVYIGDRERILEPGVYTYSITYRTTRQIGFFDAYDELYFNAIGGDWVFVIEKAEVTIELPQGAHVVQLAGYSGPAGSTTCNCTLTHEGGTVKMVTTQPLMPYEQLTFAVAWPKGFVKEPTGTEKMNFFLKSNLHVMVAVLGLLLVFLMYFNAWRKVGRDPMKGTIIPLFDPPSGFSPAEIAVLTRMRMTQRAFTASLVNMAVKGYIKIINERKRYFLERVSTETGKLAQEELAMAKVLFGYGNKIELDNENHSFFTRARMSANNYLRRRLKPRYYSLNYKHLTLGIIASVVLVLFTAAISPSPVVPMLLTVILVALVIIFTFLIKATTPEGRAVMDEIEGFKMYVTVAEQRQLDAMHEPGMTVERFEKLLPFAIALGIENQWGKKFENALQRMQQDTRSYRPEWYAGTGAAAAAFSPRQFSSTLGSSFSSAISSASSPPGSSSGSGGGGSSGGGGGGGGGGGW